MKLHVSDISSFLSIIRSFPLYTHGSGICHTVLLTACEQDQNGTQFYPDFGQFLCPSSGVFHCTHSNGICHTCLLTACEQDQDGTQFHPDLEQFLCPSSGVFHSTHSNGIRHIGFADSLLCVQWKSPDIGQRNCPKHVEFHSNNKLEKLVHLVGFIIRNLSQYTVTWTSNYNIQVAAVLEPSSVP